MTSLRDRRPRPRAARVAPAYPRSAHASGSGKVLVLGALLFAAGCGGSVIGENTGENTGETTDGEVPTIPEGPPDTGRRDTGAKDTGAKDTGPEPLDTWGEPGGAAPYPFDAEPQVPDGGGEVGGEGGVDPDSAAAPKPGS